MIIKKYTTDGRNTQYFMHIYICSGSNAKRSNRQLQGMVRSKQLRLVFLMRNHKHRNVLL